MKPPTVVPSEAAGCHRVVCGCLEGSSSIMSQQQDNIHSPTGPSIPLLLYLLIYSSSISLQMFPLMFPLLSGSQQAFHFLGCPQSKWEGANGRRSDPELLHLHRTAHRPGGREPAHVHPFLSPSPFNMIYIYTVYMYIYCMCVSDPSWPLSEHHRENEPAYLRLIRPLERQSNITFNI